MGCNLCTQLDPHSSFVRDSPTRVPKPIRDDRYTTLCGVYKKDFLNHDHDSSFEDNEEEMD